MHPVMRLLLLGAIVGAVFATVAVAAPHSPDALGEGLAGLGVAAPLVYVIMWAFLTPALVSGTLLALGAGLSFGAATGSCVGIAGATAGGIIAFAIARRFGRSAVDRLTGPRLRAAQRRVERRGFLAVLSARMAPGVPTTLLNYACGVSRVRLRDFVWGSVLGGAPRIVAYAALGASGGQLGTPALIGLVLIAALGLSVPASALWQRRRPVPA
jgi:uncharacterized membrane protein YdjX (TVP38/TMEM64 family)